MLITIWSDFACPYCYIGETNLKKAIAELGLEDVKIDYMAYELAPDMPHDEVTPAEERFVKKYGWTPEMARQRMSKITQTAQEAGLVFNYGDVKYCNTFDAHRLVKFTDAHDKPKTGAVVEALFEAFFTKGLVLSDKKVLEDIAAAQGLDRDAVKKMLDGNSFADDVRANERAAHMMGVQGVPYIVIGQEVAVPGALPVEDMKKAIRQAQQMKSGKAGGERAHTCGPEGCSLD